MKNIIDQLETLGMTPNEAKVYIASLELGPATAQQIAAKAAVVRPTAYVAIGGLVKRGLMSQFKKGKKVNFQAEKPERLAHFIAAEKKALAEREEKLEKALPYLKSLITVSGEKPEVKYYDGLDGLDAMRDVLLSSKVKQMDIVGTTQYDKVVPAESIEAYGVKLSKSGLTARQIKFSDNPIRKTDRFETKQTGSIKWIKKFIYSSVPANFAEIAIFKNFVSIVVYEDKPYGFLIQSQQVANTAKAIFEGFWNSLPEQKR